MGVGPDGSRVPEALLVLLGVEDRRAASAPAGSDGVITEIVELRRRGFRFIALADDNFYPVTLTDLQMAARRSDQSQFQTLSAIRAERFELMRRLAELPEDMVFFTQITMEAAEDPDFLDAMNKARIKGALVGVESVTPEGLKDVHKGFNEAGEALVDRLRAFKHHGVHVLGSFIFGLPSDRQSTFDATVAVAQRAGVTFAQFVMLTPFPGTTDFAAWEKEMAEDQTRIAGMPLTRHWLIPARDAPQGLHAASGDVGRRHPGRHARRVGSVLQPPEHLGARQVRRVDEGAARVRADFEAVSADVREHRHRHRQRARGTLHEMGALDRQADAPPVHRPADAGARGPRVGTNPATPRSCIAGFCYSACAWLCPRRAAIIPRPRRRRRLNR